MAHPSYPFSDRSRLKVLNGKLMLMDPWIKFFCKIYLHSCTGCIGEGKETSGSTKLVLCNAGNIYKLYFHHLISPLISLLCPIEMDRLCDM